MPRVGSGAIFDRYEHMRIPRTLEMGNFLSEKWQRGGQKITEGRGLHSEKCEWSVGRGMSLERSKASEEGFGRIVIAGGVIELGEGVRGHVSSAN